MRNLINTTDDDLLILFTADTQYFFQCTIGNDACKLASKSIRFKNGLALYLYVLVSIFSQVIRKLILSMKSKPSALILNGDLTGYGHLHELETFKDQWLTIPIRILPGLGNHDYENNVNDCVGNHCANRMLYWLSLIPENNDLELDYHKKQEFFLKTTYLGSFAYKKFICSPSGANCAYVIQLHNRPSYVAQIEAPFTSWQITNSFQWLTNVLNSFNQSLPIFINLHNLDLISRIKIRDILDKLKDRKLRIFILHAHIHHYHRVDMKCTKAGSIPSIYVGSVPNNRKDSKVNNGSEL
ncbi:unnamed protein product [Dracunculus medinensis]|uniref:Calcineurin-like phosphoesterase domain-containing protein n=1 Tax=Dracunculus medinensis TaxID=318479 RepID=A0A3P7SJZ6_DRAME|nr:unnamed protein product [Dracunculus medinensis]